MTAPRHVVIVVYPEVEVLDFAGPYEVFTTASRVHGRRRPGATAPFTVTLAAREREPVRARAGLRVLPEAAWDAVAAPDVLLVPGGVVDAECARPETCAWLAATAPRSGLVASVCTGVFMLAAAGVLTPGQRVTTHWEDLDDLRRAAPQLDVVEGVRWVDTGRVVTSAGISAGIDMSLHLVERLAGRELAEATARQMQFDWTGNPA